MPEEGAPRPHLVLCSSSADETREIAARLAVVAAAGDVIALRGALGAGKTQFVKGFARGLGVRSVVNSPSFTLMAEHAGRLPLFHLDLYRLAGAADALAGGLLDERQRAGVTLIEWADRLDGPMGGSDLEVRFEEAGDDVRRLELTARTEAGERYLAAIAHAGAPAA